MATLDRTIRQDGGGDYTTIAAWEAAQPVLGTDIWRGTITDASTYDEAVLLSVSGPPSLASYTHLTVDSAVRHQGVWDPAKANISYTGTFDATIRVRKAFTFLEGLQIYRADGLSGSNSGEAIRVQVEDAIGSVLISRCLLWSADMLNGESDGINNEGFTNTVTLDHCVIYGWGRSGINAQQPSNNAGEVRNQTWNIDHCTIAHCGHVDGAPLRLRQHDQDGMITANVHNTILFHRKVGSVEYGGIEVNDLGTGGQIVLNGSHNIIQAGDGSNGGAISTATNLTDNTTDRVLARGVVSAARAVSVMVVDNDQAPADGTPGVPSATTDFRIWAHEVKNVAYLAGVDRAGAEPDPRQDFTETLEGQTRDPNNVSIGPFNALPYVIEPPEVAASTIHDHHAWASIDKTPAPQIEGFGAGVTGGTIAGVPYVITSLADAGAGTLRNAMSAGNRDIILDESLTGTIVLASEVVQTGSNWTLDLDGRATVSGARLRTEGVDNFIIRNCRFAETHLNQGGEAINDRDAIAIRNVPAATTDINFVVNNCEFYGPIDDGSIDVIFSYGRTTNGTIANCRFQTNDLCLLIDSQGPAFEGGTYNVSVYGCYFSDVIQRQPLGGDGQTHVWNCYVEDFGDHSAGGGGVVSRAGADMRVEYCVARPRSIGDRVGHSGQIVTNPRTVAFGYEFGATAATHENIGNVLLTSLDGSRTATEREQNLPSFAPPYAYTLDTAPTADKIIAQAGARTCDGTVINVHNGTDTGRWAHPSWSVWAGAPTDLDPAG